MSVFLAMCLAAGLVAPAADPVGWPRDLFWDAPTLDGQKMAAGAALFSLFAPGVDAQVGVSNVWSGRFD